MAERGCPRAAREGRAGAGRRAVPAPEAEGPRGSRTVPGSLERRRCLYLHTGRAWCQMVEVLLAALILVCSSVSCGSAGGYTGLPALGGIYYYQYGGAYSGFSGADGERAQQLDQRFYLLKLPIARAAMVVGGCLLVFPCVLILLLLELYSATESKFTGQHSSSRKQKAALIIGKPNSTLTVF
ncbi:MARVEL domain-containing protein 3 isoform X2 [Vidua macroura]|uniref:MARVEL domain-containing protein 3 isoform X2 n=1 Tax=Vidua chalybeata TaxID=81927 RepID=UPI0023A8BAED|nr:MARVEL domain-containing protein 3 isoform X2 [Vidua chalybeata]XP_053843327.1 MARVEL domain-containing protein 3 isoform X2 [Vidua macroura]